MRPEVENVFLKKLPCGGWIFSLLVGYLETIASRAEKLSQFEIRSQLFALLIAWPMPQNRTRDIPLWKLLDKRVATDPVEPLWAKRGGPLENAPASNV